MKLLKLHLLFLPALLIFLASGAFSQSSKAPLIKALDGRRTTLEDKIYKEVNPEKRKKYIQLLYQTQEYYSKDNARMEMARENYPELVKQVEYYRALPPEVKEKRLEDSIEYQMSRSSMVIREFESNWERLSDNQKLQVCTDSVKMCLDNEQNMQCKFVLIRCKFIINDTIYKRVKKFVRDMAEESAKKAN